MAWRLDAKNPLILCPALADLAADWNNSHEAAWSGLNWFQEAGTASRSTDVARTGTHSGKLVRATAGSSGALNRVTTFSALDLTDLSPLNFYVWAYVSSFTATDYLQISANLYDGGAALLASATSPAYVLGAAAGQVHADAAWHLLRAGPIDPTAFDLTTLVTLDLRVYLASAAAATVYFDDAHFGTAFDGQDYGPYNAGVASIYPYPYDRKYQLTGQRGPAGHWGLRRASAGRRQGVLETTPFSRARRADWLAFRRGPLAGRSVTLMYRQSDAALRDYVARAVLDDATEGLIRQEGVDTVRGAFPWRETP